MKKTLKIVMAVALIAIMSVVLFACVPSDIEKATAKMEKAGYKVVSAKISYDGFEGGFTANKLNLAEGSGSLTAFYFKDKDSAKSYYEKIYGEESKNEDNTIKQNGKWVYHGTKAAVEAFEK